MYERGQLIRIMPYRYPNGAMINMITIDNVHDWGIRGYTFATIIGLDDLSDGLTRISIRVDWKDIIEILSGAPRKYGTYYPDEHVGEV